MTSMDIKKLKLFLISQSILLIFLSPVAEAGICARVLSGMRGVALSAMPFMPSLKPRDVLNSRDKTTESHIIWFKFGDRKHLLIHAGSVYLFQPFRDPDTGGLCTHRLQVKELTELKEVRKALSWRLSFTRGERTLDEAQQQVLRDALKQSFENKDRTTGYDMSEEFVVPEEPY